MTRRTSIVSAVGNYFASKGRIMGAEEYKNAADAPVRFILIKRTIGSWGRLINMIGDINNYSTKVAVVNEEPISEETKLEDKIQPKRQIRSKLEVEKTEED